MIYVYTGQIRGGKTSLMTAQALFEIQTPEKKQEVFALNRKIFAKYHRKFDDEVKLYSDYQIEYYNYIDTKIKSNVRDMKMIAEEWLPNPGAIVNISEAQLIFNARTWHNFTLNQKRFFATCGHFGLTLNCDCQDLDGIEKTIRDISIQRHVLNREIFDNDGVKVKRVNKYNIGRIVWHYEEISPAGVKIGRKKFEITHNVFDCYDSENEIGAFFDMLAEK